MVLELAEGQTSHLRVPLDWPLLVHQLSRQENSAPRNDASLALGELWLTHMLVVSLIWLVLDDGHIDIADVSATSNADHA